MNYKTFIGGAIAGAAGAILINEAIQQTTFVSGEKALDHAKAAFEEIGPISGSWIQLRREEYRKHALSTEIYRGGISCTQDGEQKQYEFISDAYSGRLLDVYPK